MRYKEGDRVTVRPDLKADTEYPHPIDGRSIYVNSTMADTAGRTITIEATWDGVYRARDVYGLDWTWTEDMFVNPEAECPDFAESDTPIGDFLFS